MGEIKNKSKSCSDGASGRVRPQALGLSLHGSAAITLEIGSRFFVDGSQDREKIHSVAHAGGDSEFFAILARLYAFARTYFATKCLK